MGKGVVNWYMSFLTQRFMCTEINGIRSELLEVVAGVPQGSISGPLLFLIYSIDLPMLVKSATTYSYADDASLLCHAKTIAELRTKCSLAIREMSEWADKNLLQINAKKTKTLPFHHEGVEVAIGDDRLEIVHSFKLLGIWIDSKLSWETHCVKVRNKLALANYILRKNKYKLTCANKLLLFHALIMSHMKYGISVWGKAASKWITPIQILQNKAIRNVALANYRDSATPILNIHNVPTLNTLYSISCQTMVKSTASQTHLLDIWPRKAPPNRNTRASEDQYQRVVPLSRLERHRMQGSTNCPKLWNDLDPSIRTLPMRKFKLIVKRLNMAKQCVSN